MNLMVQTADMSTQNHTHIGTYGKTEIWSLRQKKTKKTDKQTNRQTK